MPNIKYIEHINHKVCNWSRYRVWDFLSLSKPNSSHCHFMLEIFFCLPWELFVPTSFYSQAMITLLKLTNTPLFSLLWRKEKMVGQLGSVDLNYMPSIICATILHAYATGLYLGIGPLCSMNREGCRTIRVISTSIPHYKEGEENVKKDV